MSNKALFLGWNRPIPGRETMAMELFASLMGMLETARKNGTIDSYEPVLLDAHGGELNGFVLIRGEQQGLDKLQSSDEFVDTQLRANVYLQQNGAIRGVCGQDLQKRMVTYRKLVQEIS